MTKVSQRWLRDLLWEHLQHEALKQTDVARERQPFPRESVVSRCYREFFTKTVQTTERKPVCSAKLMPKR